MQPAAAVAVVVAVAVAAVNPLLLTRPLLSPARPQTLLHPNAGEA